MRSFAICCSIFLFISLAACGGEDDGNGGGGEENALRITGVIGNGSGDGIFRDALIVVGENFSDEMDVTLSSHTLSYDLGSATRITARLPQALTPGDYELRVADTRSSATHAVTILQGEAGLSVVSSMLIMPYTDDLCTAFDGQDCYFTGGQLLKFSDDTVLLTGTFTMLYTDGVSDTDTDGNSITMIVVSEWDWAWQRLSFTVGRSGILGSLWFVYTRDPEAVTLVFDTNGSYEIDEGDELIATLALE